MTDWQPIETAPKDKVILVGAPDKPAGDRGYYPAYVGEAFWDEDEKAFCFGSRFFNPAIYANPTHWRPLPEPPKDVK